MWYFSSHCGVHCRSGTMRLLTELRTYIITRVLQSWLNRFFITSLYVPFGHFLIYSTQKCKLLNLSMQTTIPTHVLWANTCFGHLLKMLQSIFNVLKVGMLRWEHRERWISHAMLLGRMQGTWVGEAKLWSKCSNEAIACPDEYVNIPCVWTVSSSLCSHPLPSQQSVCHKQHEIPQTWSFWFCRYASESISLACRWAYRNATPGSTLEGTPWISSFRRSRD